MLEINMLCNVLKHSLLKGALKRANHALPSSPSF